MPKRFFLIALLALLSFSLQAQIDFTLTVSQREISTDDDLFVEYTVNGTREDVGMPMVNFVDWDIISGPNTSTQATRAGSRSSAP